MTGPSGLLGPLFETDAMTALFDDRAVLQSMLDFEAALARAQGRCGVIPMAAAAPIAAACEAGLYDVADLGRATALAGNPAIPLIRLLTARVAAHDRKAALHVHWGATSQDVIDTGLVLRLRPAMALLRADLERMEAALAALSLTHADSLMAGRTLMQQALPITFGLKAAGWLSMILRVRERLLSTAEQTRVLQFGGAAGSLASLGEQGMAVAAALAADLDLTLPDLPWHSHRDRFCALGADIGLVIGAVAKIARDIALMMATEVGETFEPAAPGKGGSSAMPQKRNPVATTVAIAASYRAPGLVATLLSAMAQEHERGVGGWHAEWQTLADLLKLASGSIAGMAETLEGLEVNTAQMRNNLDLTNGLVMAEAVTLALAAAIGRAAAHQRVDAACKSALRQGRDLLGILAEDPAVTEHLPDSALEQIMRPDSYLGSTRPFITRVLTRYRKDRSC